MSHDDINVHDLYSRKKRMTLNQRCLEIRLKCHKTFNLLLCEQKWLIWWRSDIKWRFNDVHKMLSMFDIPRAIFKSCTSYVWFSRGTELSL